MTSDNWGIIGNQKVVQYLQTAMKNDKLSHAYLFLGKEHTGKRTIVDAFIRELLGSSEAALKQLANGIHPDVVVVEREEDKKNISVEQIRKLQTMLSMSSFFNSYKIAIIEDADSLSEGASNALLKVLEEPAKNTIIILITHSGSGVLPTIYSRCQILNCLPAGATEIGDFLKSNGVSASLCSECVTFSQGKPGEALRLSQDAELLKSRQREDEQFSYLVSGSIAQRFKMLESYFGKDKKFNGDIFETLDSWMLAARKKLLDSPQDSQARRTIEEITKAKKLLASNVNQKLVLEHLVLQF